MSKNLLICSLFYTISIAFFTACNEKTEITRSRISFNKEWKFVLNDSISAQNPDFEDSNWRRLNVPHDWSIEGTFDPNNPSTTSGGALPGGIGWYRKSFILDSSYFGKLVSIEFDGIYLRSKVWINGNYIGGRPYGYSSFSLNLTPYLKFDSANVIVVKVDNSQQPNSRWYSGSGIYRNVWLVTTNKVSVAHWGTFITTPEVSSEKAKVAIESKIKNHSGAYQNASVLIEIADQSGKVVSKITQDALLTDTLTVLNHELIVKKPILWSIENPYLYKAIVKTSINNVKVDEYETPFGIRYFEFDVDKGFSLNGIPVKIKGVCNHHDLGCLGAAINVRALQRQLELLKEMGCNSIRTSHNPPAPELLDLCDSMGFIVMDEAFDMWKQQKNPYDYHLEWDQWHKRDLEDMILRDRNHPSVFIWSIGNEIPEQWNLSDTISTEVAKELMAIVLNLDTTHAVTSAFNNPIPQNPIIKSGVFDLIGYNYQHGSFERFHEDFPGKMFIATETTSALATRGSYDLPSDSIRRWPPRWDLPLTNGNADYSCSSYDNCSAPWGSTHEETWKIIKKNDYLSGMYIWTGFDYIGEPTPYLWPAKSSYFGIIDMCGFPKNTYYMYQSEWTDKPVMHIFPHWNWNPGDTIDVWAYTSADEAELFINGASQGIQKKEGDALHLEWKTIFEPGTLLAIGRKNGKEILRSEIKTAGEPAIINLEADRKVITADGNDLSFITVKITDHEGNLAPLANNQIEFSIEGDGIIAGVDNGEPASLEPFKASTRKAYHGMCLVVVQSTENAGSIKLNATSNGLQLAEITITTK